MDYVLSITEAAELDIKDAFIWYQEQNAHLSITFEKHLSKTIQNLPKNPLKIQIRYNKTRVVFLKKFPYGVHFNIQGNQIIIIAVFHTSQSPRKWESR